MLRSGESEGVGRLFRFLSDSDWVKRSLGLMHRMAWEEVLKDVTFKIRLVGVRGHFLATIIVDMINGI